MRVLTLKIEPGSHFKPRVAERLRGYIGNLYKDNILFHHHADDGGILYQYPRIQYKVIDGSPYIIGVEEGVDALRERFTEIKSLIIDGKEYEVLEKNMRVEEADFGITKTHIQYRFITPWYALNQKNYKKYLRTGSQTKKVILLKQVLIGNLLSLSKSLGEVITDEIVIGKLELSEHQFGLDNIPILGFLGEFQVNFNIPDYLGIGKSVSRGFGTVIQKQNTEKEKKDNEEIKVISRHFCF